MKQAEREIFCRLLQKQMKISFAEKDDYHHHLGNIKIRLEAVAKTGIPLADTKASDKKKKSTFKMM